MAFGRRTGATAAAILPAALAGAALVAAPFAGTTTAPLAKSTAQSTHANAASSVDDGMRLDGDGGVNGKDQRGYLRQANVCSIGAFEE